MSCRFFGYQAQRKTALYLLGMSLFSRVAFISCHCSDPIVSPLVYNHIVVK